MGIVLYLPQALIEAFPFVRLPKTVTVLLECKQVLRCQESSGRKMKHFSSDKPDSKLVETFSEVSIKAKYYRFQNRQAINMMENIAKTKYQLKK